MNNRPIGVFDSGIGGLTVVKEIVKTLPGESIVYLGDTARVPYGTRGKEVIKNFALELTNYLLQSDVKALIVACNTISATCLSAIQSISPVPVLGVISPTVKDAVAKTNGTKVGVIGTTATIQSGIYKREIHKISKSLNVIQRACPLLVPLAEEGVLAHRATRILIKEYLSGIKKRQVDSLILGCTHYPLFKKIIQEEIGKNVKVIDSAQPTAHALKELLEKQNLLCSQNKSSYTFAVTDSSGRTAVIARRFFGNSFPMRLKKVTLV